VGHGNETENKNQYGKKTSHTCSPEEAAV